ncbi:ABC transporter permease [Halobacteriales archaeon QS_4_69_31]|nr:MAG: ABC transporter permease [Halobacteriales archaeon QS_4_69_31]
MTSVKASDRETRTDGGVTEDDLFNRTGTLSKRTRKERWADAFNLKVVAPLRILAGDARGVIGISLLTFVVLLGTVGPLVVKQPTTLDAELWAPPFQSLDYPLGTAALGQQVHRQIVHTTPAVLLMILSGAVFSMFVGTAVGTVAGYKSGRLDYLLMMFSDTMMTIPALPLVVVLAAFYRPSDPLIVGVILGINNWPGLARTVRSEVLSMREEDVIEAARVMGLSDTRIVRKYIIRNLMPYITVNFAFSSRRIIFEGIGLYFIGVLGGASKTWGVIMQEAYDTSDLTNIGQLHWLVFPMLMIVILVLGLILTAQAMDQLWNVRLRARHAQDGDASHGEHD